MTKDATLPTYTSMEVAEVQYLQGTGLGVVARPNADVHQIIYIDEKGEVFELTFPNGSEGVRCLDSVPWPELGRWLGHLAAWTAYGAHLEGINGAIRIEAAAQADRAQREAYMRSTADKVTDKRAEANADPMVVRLRAIEEDAHKRGRLIEGRLKGIDRMYQAVSREQSRREGEHREAGPTRRKP